MVKNTRCHEFSHNTEIVIHEKNWLLADTRDE